MPAILGSSVFRGYNHVLAISGSTLTVKIPMAASTLINAGGLPHQLETLLPASTPVSVTILDNAALGQARTIVRMADILSLILLPGDVALALIGLATARNRRRALLAPMVPIAALGALATLGIRLLNHIGGSSA